MCLMGQRDKIAALGKARDLAPVEKLPLVPLKTPNSRCLLVEKAFKERALMFDITSSYRLN
jgi:hypothetical protein